MAATEKQMDLFHKNKKCIEIAEIMAVTIYPKIIGLLEQLGIEEVHLERISGLKECCITIDSKILFFTSSGSKKEKIDVYTIDFFGKQICPYFEKENSGLLNKCNSPSEIYLKFCKTVIDAIKPLEQKVLDIDGFLNVIQNINIHLCRIVLIEKIKKNG